MPSKLAAQGLVNKTWYDPLNPDGGVFSNKPCLWVESHDVWGVHLPAKRLFY